MSTTKTSFKMSSCYIARSRDDNNLINSSSGGIFGELAKLTLGNAGAVAGARFTVDGTVIEDIATTSEGVKALLGSKYVQSLSGEIFADIQELLEKGSLVLFCATPCLCNALKKYLYNKTYANLTCVDIICHGVPSISAWKSYISFQSQEHTPTGYSFRKKEKIYGNYGVSIEFSDGNHYYSRHEADPFIQLYLSNTILRPSCYRCSAKGHNRSSDLTIGDYWGKLRLNNNIGSASVVIVNTEKGDNLVKELSKTVDFKRVSRKQGLKNNPNYYKSVGCPKNRQEVIAALKASPDQLFNNPSAYIHNSYKDKIIRKVIRIRNELKKNTFDKCFYLDDLSTKSACCGCSLCLTVCPVNAITMEEDFEGFMYPLVNDNKCIKCGKCKIYCKGILHEN